ncbi:MAG: DUF4097 family beta strand repeat-containing protein [Saprospiraceae bacterium]|nr:DUF4097 family beta strand repeat-containing protein [Saprospiraceae bacterium]
MKNWLLVISLAILTTCGLPGQSSKTERSETIKKEFTVNNSESSKLYIRNISGGFDIQGYEGNQIILEIKKTVKVRRETEMEKAWAENELGIVQRGDAILLYHKTPCSNENISTVNPDDWSEWNQLYKNNCRWDSDYEDTKFDYVIKVPNQILLNVSTVNDGDIIVKNTKGELNANNVNGAITLENIGNARKVHTINGDVKLIFSQNPSIDAHYYTLNGDINAYLKKGLSSNLYFESFNGDFYTDIEDSVIEPLPLKVEKAKESKGVAFKVGGKTGIKVRNGGPKLEFETFNGNVYIKEQ